MQVTQLADLAHWLLAPLWLQRTHQHLPLRFYLCTIASGKAGTGHAVVGHFQHPPISKGLPFCLSAFLLVCPHTVILPVYMAT